jgi:hypothetical protein
MSEEGKDESAMGFAVEMDWAVDIREEGCGLVAEEIPGQYPERRTSGGIKARRASSA